MDILTLAFNSVALILVLATGTIFCVEKKRKGLKDNEASSCGPLVHALLNLVLCLMFGIPGLVHFVSVQSFACMKVAV